MVSTIIVLSYECHEVLNSLSITVWTNSSAWKGRSQGQLRLSIQPNYWLTSQLYNFVADVLSHTTLILNRTVTHVHHFGPWVYISLLVFEVPQATWANMLKDAVVKTLIPHLQCWTQTKRTAGFKRYYPFSWSRVSQLVQWAIENYIILCKETIGIRAPFPFGL